MEGNTPQVPTIQEVQPTKPKKWLKIKILIILMILVGLGVGGFFIYRNIFVPEEKLEKQSTQPIPESILKPEFGYCAHHGEWQQLYNLRERFGYLNLSWERGMSGIANWQQIEPRRGEYHWERIDRYVRTAQEKNIQILFTVQPYTNWDQETCNMHLDDIAECGKDWGKFGIGWCKGNLPLIHRKGKPCDMEAYKEFLQRFVERYDDDGIDDMSGLLYPIRHWEIGNEVGYELQGSAEDYFEILKASYITIKKADSDAKVHISAVLRELSPEVFELGAANYFDIISGHGLEGYKAEREFLKKYDVGDKPFWVTEPGNIGKYINYTEEESALLLFQIFERESKYGVEMFMGWGGHWIDRAVNQAISHINYVKDGGDSDSFYDAWCGNKIVQEGEECETMFPIIDDAGVSARKPGTDCAPIEGMAAECIECACVYHETVCGDNIPEGGEECETAWNCEFIRGKAPTCEECKCVYHEGSYCGNDIPEKGEECENAWNCELIAGKAPTCEDCVCVYHEGSYCGNDIPEKGEECERDFDCDEPPEGFEVTCEECKCVQSKLSIRLN